MPGKGTHCTKSKLLQKKYSYRLKPDDPYAKNFSDRLRAVIERNGWSYAEAEEQIGVDKSTVKKMG